jgi:hypothetical protein
MKRAFGLRLPPGEAFHLERALSAHIIHAERRGDSLTRGPFDISAAYRMACISITKRA